MSERYTTIYKITNPKNKIYIGKTINLKRRISEYKSLNCKTQKFLYNSIKKYGWEKHNIEIICKCINSISNDLEIYFIKYYNSYAKINKQGMNLTEGGSNNKSRLGKKASLETRKKQSLARLGKVGPNKGKKLPEKHYNNLKKKIIYQYSLEGEFIREWYCIAEVERSLNISRGNIIRAAKNKQNCKIAGGFQWSYIKKDRLKARIKTTFKPVLQYDLNWNFIKEYSSITEASSYNNIQSMGIIVACKESHRRAGNFKWKYKNE